MSNFYAEGVDLKVAEKYRVPPRIPVPRDVIAHVCGDHYKQLTADPETDYNFNLERSVIHKIEEWKRVHDQTEHVRQEQLRARDRERRQLIEQEQKHLLNQVSYPSTADLSSDGENDVPGGGGGESSGGAPIKLNGTPEVKVQAMAPVARAHRLQNDFNTILQPTVVPEWKSAGKGESGSGKACGVDAESSRSHYNNNSSSNPSRSYDYSEWESDNYSPFDRMELKSINDLDILAQVLHTTQLNRTSPAAPDNKDHTPEDGPPPSPPSSPVEVEEIATTGPAEEPQQEQQKLQQDPEIPVASSSSESASSVVNYSWNMNNNHIHTAATAAPPQPNNGQSEPVPTTFPAYHSTTTSAVTSTTPHGGYGQHLQQGGYYNQHHQQPQYQSNVPAYNYQQYSANYNHYPTNSQLHHTPMAATTGVHGFNGHVERESEETKTNSLLRSRSKSVPDIVNELEEEVKASEQRRRVRNHSQSYKVPNDDDSGDDHHDEDDENGEGGEVAKASAFERLPQDSQVLAMKISRMGFPVNVVATVIEQLGNDDKKVIGWGV